MRVNLTKEQVCILLGVIVSEREDLDEIEKNLQDALKEKPVKERTDR